MTDLTAAIVETMAQPVLVLRPDLTVVMANRAFLECFEVTEAETLNHRLDKLGNGQWNIPVLRDRLNAINGDGAEMERFRVDHTFQSIGRKSMVINGRKLRESPARERILLAISDVTERDRMQKELVARAEFGEKLIDSVRDALLVLTQDLVVERANQAFYDIFRVSPEETEGNRLYDIGSGQWNIPELREALEDVLPKQQVFDDFKVTHDFPTIGKRLMLLNGRQLDHMPRILLAIRDETERHTSEATQNVMIGELQHRVKNILANVQAIASSTLRRSAGLEEFRDAFMHRLSALSRAQDLLARGSSGEVELHELILSEMSAHGWQADGRLNVAGPQVVLSRQETQAISMVIHELATNAVKYGAFSTQRGHLDITWQVAGDQNDAVILQWRESGVELTEEPTTSGFGMSLIRQSIHHMLGGNTDLAFEPGGVQCDLRFPLGQQRGEA